MPALLGEKIAYKTPAANPESITLNESNIVNSVYTQPEVPFFDLPAFRDVKRAASLAEA